MHTFDPIAYKPEPVEALRARLPKALETEYGAEFCERFPGERPGRRPENVFDFVDEAGAWRVIVSIDAMAGGRWMHVSVSGGGAAPPLAAAQHAFAQIHGPGILLMEMAFQTPLATHILFWPPEAGADK